MPVRDRWGTDPVRTGLALLAELTATDKRVSAR